MKEHLRSGWANRENENSGEKMRVPREVLWEMTADGWLPLYWMESTGVLFVY
jgi:hypothetical protein